MILDWLTKLWPTGRHRSTNQTHKFSSFTQSLVKFVSRRQVQSMSGVETKNKKESPSEVNTNSLPLRESSAAIISSSHFITMDRQRSHKRSSFRMRISRRLRAEFTPVPQQESDSDTGREAKESDVHLKPKDGGELRKDGQKLHKEEAALKKDCVQDKQSSDHSQHGQATECHYDNFTDLNVELQEEPIGFNFRNKRKSFGSESEKRRGERFLRREIEKRQTLEESDCGDADSSSLDSHTCDVNCPLITYGQCPKSHKFKTTLQAPRRSSFTSSTSKETALNVATSHGRRLRSLASLSIDDLPGACSTEHGGASKSPGLLSTASMWSTSDLRIAGTTQKPEPDAISHVGTNSLSNVSGSLGDRMHELVRAFSGRTQRAKEKISQPPTPSSDSDYDAKSAISGADEPQPPRNIRLGSFLPMGSRNSDAFSDDNHDHFVGVWHCKFKTPKCMKRMKFPATFEPHSKTYVTWLFLVALAFMYNAVVIPLRGVFPYQTNENVRYWLIGDYICDFIYLVDVLVFKVRVRFANNGIVETDWKATKRHYMKKWMFKFDLMSLLPLDLFYFIESVGVNPWLRLPRVLKIQTYWEFYERCDQASRSSAHAIRIIKTMCYMLFLIHIETCGYYAMSIHEGIGTNAWVYNGLGIAYIRCFYLAVKTATSIGNNPDPTNEKEYIFMTFYWLSGVFVFALLIGQIRDIVEAAGMVKDNYRKKMDACHWYMQSINLPKEMKDRVRQWFLYNWNQQKTIDERSLVVSLPKKLQTDLAINVHFNTLSKVQLFQDCERNLLYDLVLKLKPILYLPGDYICQKGEVGKEMYIVTQGQVEVVGGEDNNTVLATLHEGSVFGEISLLAMSGRGNRRTADVRSKGYTNVFTLSKHDFEMAMTEYPDAQAVLKKRAKKLLKANAKMEKKHRKVEAEEIIKSSPETPKLLQTVIQVMDPDSNVVKQLTPSIRRSQRSFNRAHSRSHSHRLSPTTSNAQHLFPPRSHSYRLANKTSCEMLTPVMGHDRAINTLEKDGYDTDEEMDDPVIVESSDDVSLSEVLHDAGANSSFEDDGDDEDDDDILMNEDYKKNWNRQNSLEDIRDREQNAIQELVKEGETERDGTSYKQHKEQANHENVVQPDCLVNEKAMPMTSWLEQDINSQKIEDKTSREIIAEQTIIDNNGNEAASSTLMGQNGHATPIRCSLLMSEDSMEDYIEKQRWAGNNGNTADNGNTIYVQSVHGNGQKLNVSARMEKLAPPPLVMPSCAGSTENLENTGRQRKLSVVTPPVSPVSPRGNQNCGINYSPRSPASSPLEKTNSHWAYNTQSPASSRDTSWNKAYSLHSPISPKEKSKPHWSPQVVGKKETGPVQISYSISQHEAIPIMSIPPAETVLVKNNRLTENSNHIGVKGSVLANGLEGCCGSGPLVDIPVENRITCSVEIHRQKSTSSSTTDIQGHTETTL